MQKRSVVVITKKGDFSIHSSFTKACKSYGWDREEFNIIPERYKDYKIKKIPMEVSIDCFELMHFICRKNVSGIHHWDNDNEKLKKTYVGYDEELVIEISFSKSWDYGEEETGVPSGWTYGNFKVERCFWETEDGPKEVKIDSHTENFIIEKIEI